MAKTYFVFSDVHSFYDELMTALNENGFDINNPDHIIISCGDIFDRGTKPLEVYNFLRDLPKERRILIRGNHEILLKDLVKKGYEDSYDVHNGTFDTLCYLAKEPTRYEFLNQILFKGRCNKYGTPEYEAERKKEKELIDKRTLKLFNNKKTKEIINWIFSDEWVDYYELGKYIFVHSFIPLKYKTVTLGNESFDTGEKYYFKDWRTMSSDYEWEQATWGCPWSEYENGMFKEEEADGKVLVCGHWHTSDFWNSLDYATDKEKQLAQDNNPIYKSDKYPGLIGLDACTVLSHKVNVLVLKENEL